MCRTSRVIFVSIANLNNRCFCHFMAAMLMPLGRVPTWRLHKFGWNTFSNKNLIEQGIGKVVYPSITYHISDSWLISLNGHDFNFWLRESANEPIKIERYSARRCVTNQVTSHLCKDKYGIIFILFVGFLIIVNLTYCCYFFQVAIFSVHQH